MNVSREVILDLLPLYVADEASPDTRALVERHLAEDADLAQRAEQWRKRLPLPPPPPHDADAAAAAYQEAKRRLANRVIALAAVIAFGTLAIGGAALVGAMLLLLR